MREVKDTVRSTVRVGYDGRVHKTFRGTDREKRYKTEVKVLRYLEKAGCDFVPRLLECDDETLTIITTNAGQPVEKLSKVRQESIFSRLEEEYKVRHGDPFLRNITYNSREGQFCVIDFELAEIL